MGLVDFLLYLPLVYSPSKSVKFTINHFKWFSDNLLKSWGIDNFNQKNGYEYGHPPLYILVEAYAVIHINKFMKNYATTVTKGYTFIANWDSHADNYQTKFNIWDGGLSQTKNDRMKKRLFNNQLSSHGNELQKLINV